MKYCFTTLIVLFTSLVWAQADRAEITGIVTDAISNIPIELTTIYVDGSTQAVESASNGRYNIIVPANEDFTLVFTRIGYRETRAEIKALPPRGRQQVDVSLAPIDSDIEVIVRESKLEEGGMIQEDVQQLILLPTTTGNLESVLPSIALGLSSGTGGELSSQYNVRGGNYDENLVYVNDFEIYRPQLIRAGQQEGLTFANIDLMRSLSFSSGGFEARYGDKLSSVLDIKYKRPDSLKASFSGSLLGATAHVEGSLKPGNDSYRRFRYLAGARYKTTNYLLGTLDISGEYIPNFTDIQTYLTYDLSRSWQVALLANYNRSEYSFTPVSRSTAFGLIDFGLELFSVFEGQEVDDFTTQMGGISFTYLPEREKNPLFLKFLGSAFRSDENERIDIIGDYSLRQIETDIGSDSFGDVLAELGTGTQHEFVRNFLDLEIYNFEHKGGIELQMPTQENSQTKSHFLQWSVKYQREVINDLINEWERLDSAGFSLPYDPNTVQLFNVLKTENNLESNRFTAYFQDTYTFRRNDKSELRLSAGIRANYWDLNEELVISPRVQLLYKPLGGRSDVSYRLAAGLYAQPPFYRELRQPNGEINTGLQAQKSLHVVGGMTRDFYLGKTNPKKFRLIMEAYYKDMWDLVSYEIENVRIRYSGQNDARGYAAGFDVRLNGEFVPGAESWINLSLLRTRESLLGVQHLRREIGEEEATPVDDVPRPTDQFFQFSMFFQDYFRNNENFKMHLNMTVGRGLPFGLRGDNEVFRNTYRFSPYFRIDIGFSLQLYNRQKARRPSSMFSWSRNTWLSLEVYNLMQVQNQAGNTWIKTIFDQQYAIPNFLTSRRVNLRFRVEI